MVFVVTNRQAWFWRKPRCVVKWPSWDPFFYTEPLILTTILFYWHRGNRHYLYHVRSSVHRFNLPMRIVRLFTVKLKSVLEYRWSLIVKFVHFLSRLTPLKPPLEFGHRTPYPWRSVSFCEMPVVIFSGLAIIILSSTVRLCFGAQWLFYTLRGTRICKWRHNIYCSSFQSHQKEWGSMRLARITKLWKRVKSNREHGVAEECR